MAKWNVNPGGRNTVLGQIQYDDTSSDWQVTQDIGENLEEAKLDREEGDGKQHYTKMYSIPSVVGIELKTQYGIDIYSAAFMNDAEMKMKVHLIIQRDYKYLMSTDKRV